jgi:hypothetical protein
MAIISIRFNEHEEKIVKMLSKYYHEDRSKILKKSLYEMYEDLIDKKEIEAFEKREAKGQVKFVSGEKILARINRKKSHSIQTKN